MAESGVNVKMGVSGLSEFKRSIKGAQTSIKTLDQQLALNEKQFKATGDAEAYMQQKADLLDKKLQEQKGIVAQAEKALQEMTANGVKASDEAYQKMWQNLAKAKGDLLDTEMAMRDVGASGQEAAEGVTSMNNQLKRVGDGVSWQNVTDGLDKITAGLEKVAKKAYSVGKAIVKEVLGTGGWADDINTRSKVLGVSTEDLQRMEKTARIIDTDAETIIKARQKLMKNVGTGKSDTMTALEALGISYNGNAEDAFWKAGEAIMALGDEAEQEAKANAIFGRSWHDLIPLFSAGREEYERINGTWNVMSQEQLDALNQMDDEYQKLQIAVEDLKREALSNLAEPMRDVLTEINGVLGKIGEWLQSDEGKATVENIVTVITDSLKWIIDNKDSVVAALGAIVTGWGTLKLTGAAADMLKLLNGLKGLTGGKSIGTAVGSKLAGNAALTGASTTATNFFSGLGLLPAVVSDMFLNQTNAGRGLRDGGGIPGMISGFQQDLQEKGEEISRNASTFAEDWNSNVIFRGLMNALTAGFAYGPGGEDEFDENEALIRADIERMNAMTDDMAGRTVQSTSEMTEAANSLSGLPALIESAVERGMSRVTIVVDVDTVANAVTHRVGSNMAAMYRATTK